MLRDTDTSPTGWAGDERLAARAAVHAALGEPARLAIVDDLAVSDRSPTELGRRLGLASNLLAHHLEVLEHAGLIVRSPSSGDGRRRYVRLVRPASVEATAPTPTLDQGDLLFVCTHNSARSQLAAALWTARTGCQATSSGTHPAARVHRGAVAAARRAGVSLQDATPTELTEVPAAVQVVTVCDRVHEELDPAPQWWHWSIPDPVEHGDAAAFDAVVAELELRVAAAARAIVERGADR